MMTDLFEKSIATLELPRVLEQLAACASTQEGKERCLSLRPMTDPDDVQRAQEETSAAVEMLIKRGSPGFSGVKPVGASLHRADMGGSLNTRELLEVAAVLRCARTVQDYGAGEEKTPISPPVPRPHPQPLPGGDHHQLHHRGGRAGRLRQQRAGLHPPPHPGHGGQGP